MTKEQFINSGRIHHASKFLQDRPKENLHFDCTDVVVYADGKYIQMLKTGQYFYDNNTFKTLDEAENVMWNNLQK